jgi:hypothetical protein
MASVKLMIPDVLAPPCTSRLTKHKHKKQVEDSQRCIYKFKFFYNVIYISG